MNSKAVIFWSVFKKLNLQQVHRKDLFICCVKFSVSCKRSTMAIPGVFCAGVVSELKKLAPLELAEEWDRVGLVIEPPDMDVIKKILLTVDLTEAVLMEAVQKNANFIMAYHPPIFKPLEDLQMKNVASLVAMKCIQNKIAVYSPHTALDAVKGGINDYLLNGFDCSLVFPLARKEIAPKCDFHVKFEFHCSEPNYVLRLHELLPRDVEVDNRSLTWKDGYFSGEMVVAETDIAGVKLLAEASGLFKICHISSSQLCMCLKGPFENCGMGRYAMLKHPLTVSNVVQKFKGLLHLQQLRIALGNSHTLDSHILSLAVCAGSGASILHGVRADVYITGEMSHHEILDAVRRNSTVILTEHSNSERPFLHLFCRILQSNLPSVPVIVSDVDQDPIMFV